MGEQGVISKHEEPSGMGPRDDDRIIRKLIDPRKPTDKEVEDHYRTHLPYRNWCPHCIRGKGKDMDHRKSAEENRGLISILIMHSLGTSSGTS